MAKDNWLERQAERIRKDAEKWPSWKKEAAKSDDARRVQTKSNSSATPPMRKTA